MARRPIYFDTETTGIRTDKDRIVEIAAFDPVLDRSFVSLIHPGCHIPEEVVAIHGISDEMVKNAPNFAEVGKNFVDFCHGEVALIAHNLDAFDLPFLKHEFLRNDLILPSWPTIDSLKWARRYRQDLPRHSLQFLRQIFGIPENNAHRALDDVMVLHQVFSSMVDDLSCETIIELLSSQTASSATQLDTMPFGKHQGKPLEKIPKDYVAWLATSGAFEKSENTSLKQAFEKLGLLVT